MSNLIYRRDFIKILGLGAAVSAVPQRLFSFPNNQTGGKELMLYAGTYTGRNDDGIYLLKMSPESGKLTIEKTFGGIISPSFLTINHHKTFLYAVSEVDNYDENKSGAVYSYKVNKQNLSLEFINKQSSGGAHPCHISVDRNDKYVFVANYTGGNLAAFPINKNGGLIKASDVINHEGSGVNKKRQEKPHVHSANVSPSNDYLLVSDLGIDKIMIYKIDYKNGKLLQGKQPWVNLKPGSGPRHMAFGPNGKHMYSINELSSTITVFEYDEQECRLTEIQDISTLPENFNGENTCAEIVISKDGKFVYASNRGHDSIAVFSVNEQTGKLSLIQHQSTLGRTPRNFTIDPTGNFLLAANQNSASIVTFTRNKATGKLESTGNILEVPKPVCLLFI